MSTIEERLEAKQQRIEESHRCDQGRPALLIVDMQHGFLDSGASLEVPKGRDTIPQIRELIDRFRKRGSPRIFTQFVYSPAIPCLRGDPFGPEHLPSEPGAPKGLGLPSNNCLIGPQAEEGTESAAIIEELAPNPEELVVQAHTYDKFYGTHLDLALRTYGVDRLVVTGVTTDVCVNSTVIAATTRNYRVTVAADAVATIHDDIQEACFKIWQNKFARVRATHEIMSELD